MRSAVNFRVRIWLVLFAQIINKHLRMNASINLESLKEMPQHFGWAKYPPLPSRTNIDINWQFDGLNTSFFSRITRIMKMEDPKIQKLRIDTLFRSTKVVKLVSYLRSQFNIDLIHRGVSLYAQRHFFNCEITTIIAGNSKTILWVNVTKEKRF